MLEQTVLGLIEQQHLQLLQFVECIDVGLYVEFLVDQVHAVFEDPLLGRVVDEVWEVGRKVVEETELELKRDILLLVLRDVLYGILDFSHRV